ncbi:MAG: hypothetical protein Q7T81_03295 [Pseudolabrys sp.]|nr:hypothetical protein [Pseudolabrys sp.]
MSEPTTTPQTPAQPTGFNKFLPWLLPALLIGNFLWRTLTTAHEYPSRGVQVMQMVIDAGLTIGLFGIKSRMQPWLFWLALICGLGLFAIRFTSDAAWWTGHLSYALSRR